jgi:hypothetical protein
MKGADDEDQDQDQSGRRYLGFVRTLSSTRQPSSAMKGATMKIKTKIKAGAVIWGH